MAASVCGWPATTALLLRRLSSPVQRVDGSRVSYALETLYLSTAYVDGTRDELACVEGSAVTLCSRRDLVGWGILRPGGKVVPGVDMFEHLLVM
jgi:hypothetical protein